MTKKQKALRAVGIVLLVALLAPIVILSIPRTYTGVGFSVDPSSGVTVPVVTDVTRVPITIFFAAVDGTPDDVLFFIVYAGLFGLAVWLLVRSTRQQLKEA